MPASPDPCGNDCRWTNDQLQRLLVDGRPSIQRHPCRAAPAWNLHCQQAPSP